MVIAIERFKFIARRWTGKRMMAKVMYTTPPPKRSQSASNNNWATFARLETMNTNNNVQIFNHTPPSRDRPGFLLPSTSSQQQQQHPKPLQRLQSLFQDTH
jgi:hypothetical protein